MTSGPVARSPLQPAQHALYALLTGDEDLAELVAARPGRAGVYGGAAPEGAAYPYVVIGKAIETPRNHHGGFGASVLEDLDVWDEARTMERCQAIADRLRQLLDHQDLAVTGHHVISTKHEQTLTLRDPNPELRHLLVRIRLTTEQEQNP